MTPRMRVSLAVAAAACVAAGAVVGVTVLQTRGEERGSEGVTTPRPGVPPLLLDLGLRTDAQAVQLRRASGLYGKGRRAAAERIFERYDSLDAEIGRAFARWPDGSLDQLKELVAARPRSSSAQLHLGLADYWAGRRADALAAWREAERVQPDTSAAVHASDLLHGGPPGLPPFIPEHGPPPELARLGPPQELALLAQAARRSDAHAKILYGIALQQLGRPISARRQFAAAAEVAPGDPEARVAAAVGRYTKAHPERAFSRLGPLVRVFPHAATVRFHLGLLLLWMGEVPQARKQLRRAASEAPRSTVGREARTFLDRLAGIGTK
jgi:tetratricopeptide (TPR) repeat protein